MGLYPVDHIYISHAASLLARVDRERMSAKEREWVAGRPFDQAVEISATLHDPDRLAAEVVQAWKGAPLYLIPGLAALASRDAAVCIARACVVLCRQHFDRIKTPRPHLARWVAAAENAFALVTSPGAEGFEAYRLFERERVPYETTKMWERARDRAKRKHGDDWYGKVDPGDQLQRVVAALRSAITDLESMQRSEAVLARAGRGERIWSWYTVEEEARALELEQRTFLSHYRSLAYQLGECVDVFESMGSKTAIEKAVRRCVTTKTLRAAVTQAARAAENAP